MSEQSQSGGQQPGARATPEQAADERAVRRAGRRGAGSSVVVIGPDGQPVGSMPASALQGHRRDGDDADEDERAITDLVEQPAKVMRIGSMIRQLLEEVKAAPLDGASRNRLRRSTRPRSPRLEAGLAPSWWRSSNG